MCILLIATGPKYVRSFDCSEPPNSIYKSPTEKPPLLFGTIPNISGVDGAPNSLFLIFLLFFIRSFIEYN